ncbi:AraC-like DNA-binding protein [Gracilibacillus halotolerans]|uniref:AraC-like DNA-binding protein n=1 Tax=Gracilibacillus halotolerans TaxID=74386 RepID=A0A841RM96_9BACI|nr:AraC family transcriptional regulator [Gracilibacillus halotolerans]MBB6513007.1 AraC-like DNA-binding protein [Gracilibacillus halotolerans]
MESMELEKVLAYIHQNLHESLNLSQLAAVASYSPYHFSRLFKSEMGLSPHQYVSALRLQRAKHLLLQTSLPIRDVGMEIGQQSLGTFTTRFTERVGVTPFQFRKSFTQTGTYLQTLKDSPRWINGRPMKSENNQVNGFIEVDEPFSGVIFVGLFTKPIPEGLPSYGTLLSSPGRFSFSNIAPGVYYLMVTAVNWEMNVSEILLPNQTLRAKANLPILIDENFPVPEQKLTLREPHIEDPPILISLPLLMKKFLTQIHK